jgi:hypothetical protein
VTKFAARFGCSRRDLSQDFELHRRILERYAKEHGHDPTGLDDWVMIVSRDGRVQFFPYWFPTDAPEDCDRGLSDRTPLKDPPELL